MSSLYVVGIGPGGSQHFTQRMQEVLAQCDVIVGYKPYLEYLGDLIADKTCYSSGMKSEIERCSLAIEQALAGRKVAIVSTGDAGLYGMAGPILELVQELDPHAQLEIEVVPGISAHVVAASLLGAPLMHDNAIISLSDLLTPYKLICKRVQLACEGDFVISLYNPRSKGRPYHLKEVLEIISRYRDPNTPLALVKNAGREDTHINLSTLGAFDYTQADMLSVLVVGNSQTYILGDRMITPRGYSYKA